MNKTIEKLLDFKEVMAILKVSDETLRKLIRQKKDPIPCKKVGREWRFSPSALMAWVKK